MLHQSTTAPAHDHLLPLSAAIVVGTAALMILGVQPILLSALASEGRVSEAALGRLATIEVLLLAIGSAGGAIFFRVRDTRLWTCLLAVALVLANFATVGAHSRGALFSLRAVAGLVEGLLLGVTVVVITRAHSPDRVNGVFLAVQTIPQALAAFWLPVTLIPRYGANAGFGLLGLIALVAMACSPLLPRGQSSQVQAQIQNNFWAPSVVLGVLGVGLQSAGIGAAWNYSTALAAQHNLSPNVIGLASSGSLIFQVLGGFLVAAWAWRLPSALMLLVGSMIQVTLVVLLPLAASSGTVYITLCWLFGVVLLALGPYQVAHLIRLEPTRRAALLITSVTLVGWSVGPFLASLLVSSSDCSEAFAVSACLFVAGALAYSASALRYRVEARELAPL